MKHTIIALALLGAATLPARAQVAPLPASTAIELQESHVRMEIRDNVAVKRLRLVFHNPNPAANGEADFLLPLEPDQKVDRFSVRVGGKEAEGELLDQEKARKIYEDIVRKKKDPALLEYYGHRLLRVRLFPLPPKSDFEVLVETLEPLQARDGVVRVPTLLSTSATAALRHVTVEATISNARTILSVFSPTHAADVVRRDPHEARLTYDKRQALAGGAFTFYYTLGDRDLAATILASPDGEDGAFMLTLTPPAEVKDEDRLPRDVTFLLDTSGSMNEQGKIDQAKAALKKFVATLTDRDRFNIVTFSTEAQSYSNAAVDATDRTRKDALSWIDSIRARGGTNLEEALQQAQLLPTREAATRILVLLSDGTPTVGERETKKLVARAKALGARVFAFGVGADVQTQLLDRLAIETGGDRQYVNPKEDLALVLENFARRIDAPVLADLAVELDGQVSEVHPRRLPDLFKGGEVTIYGRFRGVPPRQVTLTGTALGKSVRRTFEVAPALDARHAFVARLWAIQKIDFLIDEIRERGASKELVDHIVEIAKRYGIVTPYTSSLMTEDAPTAQVLRELNASTAGNFTGQHEVNRVGNQMAWRGAKSLEGQMYACNGALGRGSDAAAIAQTLQEQRLVCNRAFTNGKAGWAEATYSAQKVQTLKFGSDEFFRFVRENPEAAPIVALGNQVTFQHRNCWYRIEA